MQAIINQIITFGARMAHAGEFTESAFLNGKMDLIQAEAVKELIDSVSIEGATAACHAIRGAVTARCHALENVLRDLRAVAETYLDFSDSDVEVNDFKIMQSKLADWLMHAEDFCEEASRAACNSQQVTVAILGLPNAGKSSLMNILTHDDTSIVSDKAGTTRDIIKQEVVWGTRKIHLLDTAGIRETECDIEREGIERIYKKLSTTQLILWIIDITHQPDSSIQKAYDWLAHIPLQIPVMFVYNKIDRVSNYDISLLPKGVAVSCYLRSGIADLVQASLNILGDGMNAASFYASQRQVQSLKESIVHAKKALVYDTLDEIYAEALRQAHRCCMKMTGHYHTEDLLGDIFSKFCIGK